MKKLIFNHDKNKTLHYIPDLLWIDPLKLEKCNLGEMDLPETEHAQLN